jgi:hypothetical protein
MTWVREGIVAMMSEMSMVPCGPDEWHGEIEGYHVHWNFIDGSLFIVYDDKAHEITVTVSTEDDEEPPEDWPDD